MTQADEELEPDVMDKFDESIEGELKQAMQEENLPQDDYDASQGFDYPQQTVKDSITKFYRHVIDMVKPISVVRVSNFTYKAAKNARIYLSISNYNRLEGCEIVSKFFEDEAVVLASVNMGYKGFIITSIMTQRRIVQREGSKPAKMGGYGQPQQQQGGK